MQNLIPLVLTALALAHTALSFGDPVIPLGWTTQYACAVDTSTRVLAGDTFTDPAGLTPATCIEHCDSLDYEYAGVEAGVECHCGTGLQVTPTAAPTSDCNTACSGDATLSCGGTWYIQIYKSPALAPGDWCPQGCFYDTSSAPAFSDPVQHFNFSTNTDFVEQCRAQCQHIGYPLSGTEDGTDCQCAFGFSAAAEPASPQDCRTKCPLSNGAGYEFCGGSERLTVYQYMGAN